MKKIIDTKENLKLVQSYDMIEARFNISPLALNIFYFMVTQVDNRNDKEFFEYKITKVELDRQLNLNTDYNAIKRAAEELTSRSVNIQDLNKNGFKYRALFSVFDYESGVITVKINNELKEHFLNLKKNFVSVNFLKYVVQIKNSYAKRMYFLLKQRLNLHIWKFDLDYLRDILQTPKYMQRYKEFRIHILDKTVEEINKHTDLKISYNEIKVNRKVIAVNFLINTNSDYLTDEKEKKNRMKNRSKFKNSSMQILKEWYEENTEEVIEGEVIF